MIYYWQFRTKLHSIIYTLLIPFCYKGLTSFNFSHLPLHCLNKLLGILAVREEYAVNVLSLPGTRHIAIHVPGVVKFHTDGVGVRVDHHVLDLGEGDVPHLALAAAVVLSVKQVVNCVTAVRRRGGGRGGGGRRREGKPLNQVAMAIS